MSKYVYPAIFIPEEGGAYSVSFPDIQGCYTYGDDLADAVLMAEDALAMIMCDYENNALGIPEASEVSSIKIPDNAIVNFIACNTKEYRAIMSVVGVLRRCSN